MIISTAKKKIVPLKEKELITTEIMLNNTITEQVTNFNYLGCLMGTNRNYCLQNKLQGFDYLCEKIKCTLFNKT